MPATIEYTEATGRYADSQEPRLHAFPEGSNVALCGRVKKPGGTAHASKQCRACVEAASGKFFGRRA